MTSTPISLEDLVKTPAPAVPAPDPRLPTWAERAEMRQDYEAEQQREAAQQELWAAAVDDVALLRQTLERLQIPPLPPHDAGGPWFQLAADGTVSALIARPEPVTTGGYEYLHGRQVWVCAYKWRVWLRAADDEGHVRDVAGPYARNPTLADVEAAYLDGPPPAEPPARSAPVGYAAEAERIAVRARPSYGPVTLDDIDQAVTGLTYAVLAVAEQLGEGADGLYDTLSAVVTDTMTPPVPDAVTALHDAAAALSEHPARGRWFRRRLR